MLRGFSGACFPDRPVAGEDRRPRRCLRQGFAGRSPGGYFAAQGAQREGGCFLARIPEHEAHSFYPELVTGSLFLLSGLAFLAAAPIPGPGPAAAGAALLLSRGASPGYRGGVIAGLSYRQGQATGTARSPRLHPTDREAAAVHRWKKHASWPAARGSRLSISTGWATSLPVLLPSSPACWRARAGARLERCAAPRLAADGGIHRRPVAGRGISRLGA